MENDTQYSKRRKTVGLISLVVLVVFFAIVTALLWKPITGTFSHPDQFRIWVNAHGITSRLAFIGMVAVQVVFALIPGEPLEIGAGYAFGAFEGLILCLIGMAVGTTIIYLFTKLYGVRIVEAFISREKIQSLRFLNNSRKINLLVAVIFFIPGTPKDMITYFIGLTPMRLRTFLILSSIARIPSVLTSTITGNALGTQNYPIAMIVFLSTAVISLLGVVLYYLFSSRHKGAHTQQKRDD